MGVDVIQLHGDEQPIFIRQLRSLTGRPIIKALRVGRNSLSGVPVAGVDHILLDTAQNGVYGGTGRVFDWKAAAKLRNSNFFLAGGLTPGNVAQAVASLRPFAVDMASGVESSPGKKDAWKLERFITRAKKA